MRVAQIVPSLDVGGLERLAVDLSVAQRDTGHEPIICCIRQKGVFAADAERCNIPVFSFNKQNGFSWSTLWKLARELRARRVDVVHTHNAVIHHYGVLAAHLAGVPIIVNSWHGIGSLVHDRHLARIYKSTLPFTTHLVAVSDHTKTWLEERFHGSPPITTIRNGIRLEPFSTLRARPGSRRPVIRFGTVGRMVPIKNQKMLLTAFGNLYKRFPSAELHLAGDGPLRQELQDTAKSLNLNGSVHFHGELSDVPRFLAGLDVFVLSSESEALPLVILEAMAAGLPIVATRVGGISEVAGERLVAFYSSAGDSSALAANMAEMAASPNLAEIGRRASETISSNCSVSSMWREYELLFEHLLANRRNRTSP